ncbi:zinc finger mym-type protein 3 isoform [Lynx pardinus]|uniref:Zinc finger mym-type protein 3 isoform n=1 Tax=Lynx pardinus TaxID=191816 RepID=A0A485PGI7_LYNPA|nr:zinc finger mym-type protein 3 isoform [Lynx pardinus]
MDPSDFPSPFDPLTLPEKPLAGDLPVDMEFGEDLLESQTAPTRGWAPPGPSPSSGALDLLDAPAGLEKDPGVLDGATELLGLGGLLYKAPSPPEVDHGPEGTLAWDAGDQTLEPGPGGQTPEVVPPEPEAGANPSSPQGLLEPLAPDSPITLQPPHIEEEETTNIATGRRGSPGQEEELPQGQPQSPNGPPSPSVGETLGDGINSSQTKPGGPSPPAHPSLPGDGLTGKASEKPPERKRSERVRRVEPPKPEVVDSTESIPVSDEDSDAMVDDPNDEDFVPFRPRRSPRMSLRSSVAQRAGRSAVGTKMTCAHCRTPLQKGQTAYQRKGLPQLFCSSSCLTTFSKKPSGKKTCTFCKKEIWNTKDSVVAQTGSGGSFHEFCTSVCLSLYEAQQQRPIPQSGDPADATRCSICQKTGEVLHEVSNGSVVHRLCSDSCFSKFRANKGLKTNCCDQCGAYIYTKTGSPGPELLFHEGQQKRFCNTTCLGAYKKKNTRVYPCVWCKTLCKNFEMLSHVDRNGKTSLFCTLCCTTSYKVKQAGLTGPPRPCSFCRRSLSDPCYYNKVDRTVYQFCSPSCWTKFQRTSPEGGIHLSCHYCHSLFSGKPEIPAKTRSAPAASTPPPPPPPPATPRKNKAAMCKPLMQNRGVSCKVEMKSKGSQTEEWKPQVIVLPIPVPIFVPVPMHLYCQKVPVPFSMPIPVPVPMFLPTTLESTDKIVETIEELKVKIPSNPLEADILAMAEMIAEAEELDKASSDLCDLVSNQSAEGLLEDCDLFGPARDDVLAMAVKMANVLDEPGQDLEADFPKNPLDINPSVDFLFDCGLVGPEDVSTEQDLPRTMRKGQKRLVLSESCSRDSMSSQPSCTGLNYSYGVNAWKCWVQSKYANGETSKGDELRFGPKPMRIKEDILACSAAELNYGLAQFVREITRPNGERYEPDSIYYLCLGIQQYLLENNRMVNIFTDLYYLTFVQELNKSLSTWQPTLLPNNTVFSRVEEEHLWECKQLGVYSPFVLLNTLMFFNTKFFGLQTAEEHMQLSFTNVVRQSRKCTTPRGTTKVVSIRYYAPVRQRKGRDTGPGKRKREEEAPILEQRENRMNPLRCPVKFYEFYLSKCPESLRTRNDVFYLQPERSCIAESPLWYSVIPMDRSMLESMLNRILAVREIYEELGRPGEEDLD